jgi:hypothetical protein
MERQPQVGTGQAIDEFEEHLYETVRGGDTSPGALQKLKELYLRLERLWVTRGEGKSAQWQKVASGVDASMRDGAVILGGRGMIHEDIGK